MFGEQNTMTQSSVVAGDLTYPQVERPENDIPTPYLATNLGAVALRLDDLKAAIPGLSTFYAMKCKPEPVVLCTLAGRGASFEVASFGEVRVLQSIGVDPSGLLYSNPI